MWVEALTIVVQEGFSDQVVHRFSQEAAVEKAPGFVDLSILVKKARKGEEEIIVMIRWESEEAWKQWEVSEPHLEGHRREREHGKPEFVLRSSSSVYAVKAVKTAPAAI
ncbi:heme oxygenase (staphylobilin-producing) [Paenibacillus sp. UNCCL117]|uniref:antibiotic biosynthesis monooxygenase family protein n=1 Tax=unclassified Paenibacillus TaxID=185978 RepID=UPI000882DF23|nr:MULTISPECIES: antibiotic biosynthesis monooxygenase [unclassified Paenibacillus]SDD12645.1 heme oxygenase (staphylobilin-producing) [Paenibacillus sp. cl123]SFW33830.1 heme oxygenase (staphylobilin-producing) [Paenibacillus sp. UNCCL117]